MGLTGFVGFGRQDEVDTTFDPTTMLAPTVLGFEWEISDSRGSRGSLVDGLSPIEAF
jgi:hypothetical protein